MERAFNFLLTLIVSSFVLATLIPCLGRLSFFSISDIVASYCCSSGVRSSKIFFRINQLVMIDKTETATLVRVFKPKFHFYNCTISVKMRLTRLLLASLEGLKPLCIDQNFSVFKRTLDHLHSWQPVLPASVKRATYHLCVQEKEKPDSPHWGAWWVLHYGGLYTVHYKRAYQVARTHPGFILICLLLSLLLLSLGPRGHHPCLNPLPIRIKLGCRSCHLTPLSSIHTSIYHLHFLRVCSLGTFYTCPSPLYIF